MASGSRFLPLDPEGQDEGDAEIAANFDPDNAAGPGDEPRGNHDGDDDAAPPPAPVTLLPLQHSVLEPPLRRFLGSLLRVGFAVLGTTAVAVAVRGALPAHVPDQKSFHPTVAADGLLPPGAHLLHQESVWGSIPRGGTSIAETVSPRAFARLPLEMDDGASSSHSQPLLDVSLLDLNSSVHWSQLSPRHGTAEATPTRYPDHFAGYGFPTVTVARIVAVVLVLLAFTLVYLLKTVV